jgi:hypothetical protein
VLSRHRAGDILFHVNGLDSEDRNRVSIEFRGSPDEPWLEISIAAQRPLNVHIAQMADGTFVVTKGEETADGNTSARDVALRCSADLESSESKTESGSSGSSTTANQLRPDCIGLVCGGDQLTKAKGDPIDQCLDKFGITADMHTITITSYYYLCKHTT